MNAGAGIFGSSLLILFFYLEIWQVACTSICYKCHWVGFKYYHREQSYIHRRGTYISTGWSTSILLTRYGWLLGWNVSRSLDGRRGSMEWSSSLTDLSPLDFFLWRHIKSKVFSTPPDTLENLSERIVSVCREVTPEMLKNVLATTVWIYFISLYGGSKTNFSIFSSMTRF